LSDVNSIGDLSGIPSYSMLPPVYLYLVENFRKFLMHCQKYVYCIAALPFTLILLSKICLAFSSDNFFTWSIICLFSSTSSGEKTSHFRLILSLVAILVGICTMAYMFPTRLIILTGRCRTTSIVYRKIKQCLTQQFHPTHFFHKIERFETAVRLKL